MLLALVGAERQGWAQEPQGHFYKPVRKPEELKIGLCLWKTGFPHDIFRLNI